ncbi:hypothetical protein QTP88_001467 [Uroleucon formosanum]
MFNEIASQREQMYESIGMYVNSENKISSVIRNRRELINIIGSTIKTLFGVCDDDCTKETNSNIEKIETSNENMLHIIKSQTTVVKSVVQGIGNTYTEMNKLCEELGVKQGEIYKKLNEAANNTHTIETMILSNRIHNIFTALITQFSYETTTISAIITAARTGILHPSLVTPRELANQLTQIKLNLPVNLNLPTGTKPNEIYELSKITKMAVYYSGTQIVFLIKIPLITKLEFTLFKIIPLPHKFDFNHSIISKPEFQYVGITKNRRQFTTFTETQLLSCTETEIFNICPEFQPIQHESERQPCEVSLFKNPDVLPRNCEAGIIVITKNIYHKLKYANTWIYTTTNDTLTITCQGEQEPHIIKLQNQGVINLNQECRAYANDIVLNPTREIKSKYYVNFIPKLGIGSLTVKIPKFNTLSIPKYKQGRDLLKLNNVHELAHSLNDIQSMVDKELDRQSGNPEQTKHYIIYILLELLLFSLILILLLYTMYRYNRNLKRTYSKNIRRIENPVRKNSIINQQVYEPMVRINPKSYDMQGPIVNSTSYEEREGFPRKQEDSIIFFEIFLIQLLSTEAISQTWITVELRSTRFNSTTLGKPSSLLPFNYGEKIKQTE